MNLSATNLLAVACGIGVLERADEIQKRAQQIATYGADRLDDWICCVDGIDWIKPMGPGFGCV